MTADAARYLERVEIENFRAYGDSFTLSLPEGPGVTLIYGPNGLGKTTFFDAVEWCLTSKVSRFNNYVTGALERSGEHLTRRGALPDSHRVSLYFTGANPIDRGQGASPASEEIVELLKQPTWPEVSDLGAYLSLTHFLGQAAAQRFSVKDAKSQWAALKGPAGVDRINHVHTRLGGRAAQFAFKRRIERAEAEVERARTAIEIWRGLSERLKRAHSLSRVRDVLPPAELAEACGQIIKSVRPLLPSTATLAEPEGAPEAILEEVRNVLQAARDQLRVGLARSASLEGTAEELQRISGGLHAVDQLLSAETARASDSAVALAKIEEELRRALTHEEEASRRLNEAQARVGHLNRIYEAAESYILGVGRAKSLSDAIHEAEATLRSIDSTSASVAETLRDLVSRVASRERLALVANQLKAAAEVALEIADRNTQLELAARGAEGGRSVEEAQVHQAEILGRLQALSSEAGAVEGDLAELDRRIGVLSALVGQVRGMLGPDDTECPVCASEFSPGELILRIEGLPAPSEASAHALGERLAAMRAEIAVMERELAEVNGEIRRLNALHRDREILAQREAALLGDVRDLVDEQGAVTLNDVAALSDLYQQELERAQLAAQGERNTESCRDELRALQAERASLPDRIAGLRSDASANSMALEQLRLFLSQYEDVWNESEGPSAYLREARTTAAGSVEVYLIALAEAEATRQALETQAAFARRRAEESVTAREAAELQRAELVGRMDHLLAQWRAEAPLLEPSLSVAWQLRSAAESGERNLSEAEHQLERMLAGYNAWRDDVERQELEASVRALILETGVQSEDELDAHLTRAVADAEQDAERLRLTRDAALKVADRLKEQADQYAQSVLEPLSDVIDRYARALMPSADGSLFYRAQFQKNRSALRSGIKLRDDDGSPEEVDLNPNLYFSEGQLSALSVSSMLAASTTFRWSRWPALLMDDPLQHNDVIHASAFIDLLRRLVQKRDYQVILSTHDSDEAEYIARKCLSVGVAFRVCELRPAGSRGLIAE